MLFDSTVRKELSRGFGATLVVILTIVLTNALIRTVGQAANGAVAPQDVVLLLGYLSLSQLPMLLALSLFVAVVLGLGRMYRDSEMVIWFSSGVGLRRFIGPVMRTCYPVLVLCAGLLLIVGPWGHRSSQELRERYQQRSDLARVTPGVFQRSSDGRRVFFVERESVDGVNARNVFILSSPQQSESVTTAAAGRLVFERDQRYLILQQGQSNQVQTVSGERTLSRFETYRVPAGEKVSRSAQRLPPKLTDTLTLIREPTPSNQGELTWRLGMVLGAGNLLLLGIGLAATNPRRASNWNLLFALLSFVVYYNLINLSQAWVASGRLPMGAALLCLHGGALAVAWALLWWRDHGAARLAGGLGTGWLRRRALPA
jgi:lipopolysaccharide export system permease protein